MTGLWCGSAAVELKGCGGEKLKAVVMREVS